MQRIVLANLFNLFYLYPHIINFVNVTSSENAFLKYKSDTRTNMTLIQMYGVLTQFWRQLDSSLTEDKLLAWVLSFFSLPD
jgi:hypothetical protein